MFSWIRGQIVRAWNNRRSSREARRRSLARSLANPGNRSTNSDTTMFASSHIDDIHIFVNIISIEGNIFGIGITSDLTIEKIKTSAIKHFYGEDTPWPATKFRLVHASRIKSLSDQKTITEENIANFDELLLIENRPPTTENLTDEALKGPNEEAIFHITSDMPIQNLQWPELYADYIPDFQSELRKMLITLVQSAAKILNYCPEVGHIIEIIKERFESTRKPENDPKTVQYLMDMGFSEKKVLNALCIKKMNTSEALEWLLEHMDDLDDEDLELPSFDMEVDEDTEEEPSSSSGISNKKKSFSEACQDLCKGGNPNSKRELNLIDVTTVILDSFKHYKRLEFKPKAKIISSLKEMGFEEKQILEALKVTGNNQVNAYKWLIGGRHPNLEEVDDGLDPNGPVYESVMTNPQIQLSLTSPKMLLAYLSMLEDMMSLSVWINDQEASPVLTELLKIYHLEKYSMYMKRYTKG